MVEIGVEKEKISASKTQWNLYLDINAKKLGIISGILTGVVHSQVGVTLIERGADAVSNFF